jgi:hypothetical protein
MMSQLYIFDVGRRKKNIISSILKAALNANIHVYRAPICFIILSFVLYYVFRTEVEAWHLLKMSGSFKTHLIWIFKWKLSQLSDLFYIFTHERWYLVFWRKHKTRNHGNLYFKKKELTVLRGQEILCWKMKQF